MITYYETLGIERNASEDEIRRAYRALAKKYHPDVYEGNERIAQARMQEINRAYAVLSDAEKRRDYDLTLIPQDGSTESVSDADSRRSKRHPLEITLVLILIAVAVACAAYLIGVLK